MIHPDKALEIVLSHVTPMDRETVGLREVQGRVLAEPIYSDLDYPPFARAMMDGYAVQSADASAGCTAYTIAGQIAAGTFSHAEVKTGQAIQINTGAPIPPGADAVVPFEETEQSLDGSRVNVKAAVGPGQHIARRAEYAKSGQCVLEAGLRMGPGEIGVAAGVGATLFTVYRQPTVAILVTGDELVDAGDRPAGAQIRNTNGYVLDALVRKVGGKPVRLGVVGDREDALMEHMRLGLAHDFLCITGGISMGKFDHVPAVLNRLGCEMRFQKVAIKPAKPTLFATHHEAGHHTLVFGLSGNPLSCVVGFLLFAEPAIRSLQCCSTGAALRIQARLVGRVGSSGGRKSYWPGRLENADAGELRVRALRWHGSGDPFGLAAANAMIVRAPEAPAVVEGEVVEVMVWPALFSN